MTSLLELQCELRFSRGPASRKQESAISSNMQNGAIIVTSSPLPLYWKIFNILREQICDGVYTLSGPLPTEVELSKRFETSRITIRKALEILKSEGFVVTRKGVGTFVRPKLPEGSRPRAFEMNLTSMWEKMETRILEFGFVPAPANIAGFLEVEPGARVHKSIRYRAYKRQPAGLLTTYIHERVARNFVPEDFINAPLIKLYKREGYPSHTAVQRIYARSADPMAAEHLNLEIGAPILCISRISRDINGQPISYFVGQFCPERYEIEFDLKMDGPSQQLIWSVANTLGPDETNANAGPEGDEAFHAHIHPESDVEPE